MLNKLSFDVRTYTVHIAVFSQHTQGMSAQQAFSTDFPLMWEWEECNSFDVASGSTQVSPSCRALKIAWGEQCIE